MDNLAGMCNAFLEDAKRGWICNLSRVTFREQTKKDHHTMQAARFSLYFSAFSLRSTRSRDPSGSDLTATTLKPAMTADWKEVSEGRDENGEATNGRVGAMGADRNEADIPLIVPARLLIGTDYREACIFSRSSRIRLQRAGLESGNDVQVFFEFLRTQLAYLR